MPFYAADQPAADAGKSIIEEWGPLITAAGVTLAAVIALIVAIGNRRQTEKHWRITSRRERFTTIASQLADHNPAVRTAGIYAMEALTNDWLTKNHWYSWTWTKSRKTGHREAQACINVLCAYLRLPYTPPPGETTITKQIITTQRGTTKGSGAQTETHHEYRHDDKQVRTSIINTIAAHLKPNPPGESWSKLDFDFTGAHLHDANFKSANFASTAVFTGAQFHGEITSFGSTQFHGINTSFGKAVFRSEHTSFIGAQFRSVYTSFSGVQFHGINTLFDEAQFSGENTLFSWAQFHGWYTSFIDAQFRGETTSFGRAEFHGEITSFDSTQFHGEITFDEPVAWANMLFDWTWPLPDGRQGPAIAKPQNVKPDEWPPTLAN